MSNKKAFNELTEAGKKDRLAKYAAQDAKYGLKEGLFRVVNISRHENRTFGAGTDKEQTVASYGYNVVPVKGVDEADFPKTADGKQQFFWVNQLINTATGAKVIDAMDQLAADVNPKGKSSLVSIKYKTTTKNGNTYVNVNSVFRRDRKTSASSAKSATPAAAPKASQDEMPF